MAQLPVFESDPSAIREIEPDFDEYRIAALVDVARHLEGYSIRAGVVGVYGTTIVLELGPYYIYNALRDRALDIAEQAGLTVVFIGGREENGE